MKYALLIYADEKAWESVPHDERHAIYEEYDKFANELVERGVMRGGDQLADSPAATTVRVRDGQQLVTDGPFAETKEQLGGYFLVEVDDLDTAIELASKIPGVPAGLRAGGGCPDPRHGRLRPGGGGGPGRVRGRAPYVAKPWGAGQP